MLDKFQNNKDVVIPELKQKRSELKQRLKNAKTTDDKLELKDEIDRIKLNITNLIKEEKEYYLNNSKIIFEYFERKDTISKGTNEKKILDDFFNIKNTQKTKKKK